MPAPQSTRQRQQPARFSSLCPQCRRPIATGELLAQVINGAQRSWMCRSCGIVLQAMIDTSRELHGWESRLDVVAVTNGRATHNGRAVADIKHDLRVRLTHLREQAQVLGWPSIPREEQQA